MTDNPSFVEYTGAGSVTDFVFPFAYLDADHIAVTVNGVEKTFTLPFQNTVRISPAPTGLVRIARVTPATALVTWNDGAVILGKDLNLSSKQPVFVAEEARDIAAEAKEIAETSIEGALVAVIEAQGHAGDAEASAVEAATSAAQAAELRGLLESIYDAFDDRYLGMKTVNPAVDNDGDPLQIGAIYFNTTAQELRVYTTSGWTAAYLPSNGGVNSFNGRTGAVLPANGDYSLAQITGAQSAIDGKAATSHTHTIANVTSLQTTLDGKAPTAHTHTIANVTNLQAALDGKAASAHVHAVADVSGLQSALDTKVSVYTGTDSQELNYPIGHTILAIDGSGNQAALRNATVAPRRSNSASEQYIFNSTSGSTALSGTWRSRGAFSLTFGEYTYFYNILQRVA